MTTLLLFPLLVVDVEHSHVRFLGNLVLNLWDCGGYDRAPSAGLNGLCAD
jgi:hypothetical protein